MMDKHVIKSLEKDIDDIMYLLSNIETLGEDSKDGIMVKLIQRRCSSMMETIHDNDNNKTLLDERLLSSMMLNVLDYEINYRKQYKLK